MAGSEGEKAVPRYIYRGEPRGDPPLSIITNLRTTPAIFSVSTEEQPSSCESANARRTTQASLSLRHHVSASESLANNTYLPTYLVLTQVTPTHLLSSPSTLSSSRSFSPSILFSPHLTHYFGSLNIYPSIRLPFYLLPYPPPTFFLFTESLLASFEN